MGMGAPDDTWEWLQLPTGWVQYEVLERIAICRELGAKSDVSEREATDIACRQVGAAGYAQSAQPPSTSADTPAHGPVPDLPRRR